MRAATSRRSDMLPDLNYMGFNKLLALVRYMVLSPGTGVYVGFVMRCFSGGMRRCCSSCCEECRFVNDDEALVGYIQGKRGQRA
jgi:hypothetical protein